MIAAMGTYYKKHGGFLLLDLIILSLPVIIPIGGNVLPRPTCFRLLVPCLIFAGLIVIVIRSANSG